MNSWTRISILAALMSSLLVTDGRLSLARSSEDVLRSGSSGVRFQITAIEESAAGRKVISRATIDGPPGTDFNIDLNSSGFKMNARFLTDMISSAELKVRAKLTTRRLYGYSASNLPLFEEDAQNETLQVGFDEQIVLLPFGRGGGDVLRVEVIPSVLERHASVSSGKNSPIEINIPQPSPGGISIQASRIPHNFVVDATLLENGREVARGSASCSIEEQQQILLQPTESAGPDVMDNPVVVQLTVDRYERGRPADQVAVRFDAQRIDKGQHIPVALNWAGVSLLGAPMQYDLGGQYLKSDKKYELRLKTTLAVGETAN